MEMGRKETETERERRRRDERAMRMGWEMRDGTKMVETRGENVLSELMMLEY